MRIKKTYVYCLIAVALLASGGLRAEEIKLPFKGLTLNATLELAAGKAIADGAIVMTHAGLAHGEAETMVYLQNLLKEKGYNTLAITLSLGRDNRHGPYDCKIAHRHRYADAADEIAAWVAWLKTRGAQRVAVLGHSRGGGQTAVYAAEHEDASVKAVVLLAPATRANSNAADYRQRTGKPLAPILAKAQKLVNDGKGGAVLANSSLLACRDSAATADSFVSYYGPDPRLDTPYLIPKLKLPTLIVVAGNDEIVVGLDKHIAPLADGKRVQMKVVDAADHFFRDLYADDAVDAIDGFLKNIPY